MPESCPKGSSHVIAKKTKEFVSPAEEVKHGYYFYTAVMNYHSLRTQ
jgi:hypothetical protein